jgi:hypothetical protein
MAVALASLASSALASLAVALIAIWLCSRFVLPRIISFAVRRLRDRPRAFVSPEKTRVSAASSSVNLTNCLGRGSTRPRHRRVDRVRRSLF